MKRLPITIIVLITICSILFAGCQPEVELVELESLGTVAPTDKPTDEPHEENQGVTSKPANTPQPTEDTRSPYYIYVEKGSHTITIYTLDDAGEYTNVLATYRTGTGKTQGKTPVGIFELYANEDRDRWHSFGSDQAWAQYATPFTSGIYFHSALYRYNKIDSMYHDQYYEIGTNITAGCLRTTAEAAYFIFNDCPPGTIVEIVNGNPLDTTSAPEPSINPDYQHYDPTDPEIEPNKN